MNCLDEADRLQVSFARATDRREAEQDFTFCCVKIITVLIDSASKELSNGCHIVFWSNLHWTSALEIGMQSRISLSNPVSDQDDRMN